LKALSHERSTAFAQCTEETGRAVVSQGSVTVELPAREQHFELVTFEPRTELLEALDVVPVNAIEGIALD
jgi:hypothetical protein